jgi:beta-glucosidase
MTLDEKVAQLGSVWGFSLLEGRETFSREKARKHLRHGIGQITRPAGGSGIPPEQVARFVNDLQHYLIHETRMGIPALLHEECLSGFQTVGATIFPQMIGVAATFDPDLVSEMTMVLREQLRALHIHQGLAPVLDVARDVRWGRVEETCGEDPYLVSALCCAYVEGLRGPHSSHGVMATLKHFAGYGASQGGLNWAPAHLSARELREVYLLPFEAAVRKSGALAVMNAYHEIDGIPCGSSEELLSSTLRGEWGFEGIVVSDYSSIKMLSECHRLATTREEAALIALRAGVDVELPEIDCFNAQFKELFHSGKAPVPLLDRAVERILRVKFLLGLFEEGEIVPGTVEQSFDRAEHRALARKIAAKSIVLLKNDHALLPLSRNVKTLAVIGPNADSWRNQLGDYSYPAACELQRHLDEGLSPDEVAGLANPTVRVVTLLEGIRNSLSPSTEVLYARGCGVTEGSREGFAEAEAIARRSEVAILAVGGKSGFMADCTSGEGHDRLGLSLMGVQHELIRHIHATGTPVVMVLIDGRPASISWEQEHLPAMLAAWLPGEEGGNAVADVLFGEVSPGGRLPVTFPSNVGQVPLYYSHKPSGSRSHLCGAYVDGSVEPLYPFGHGLSYTSFDYSGLAVSPEQVEADGAAEISCSVTNSGMREGDEVVQLYIQDLVSSVTRPVMELKAFKRLALRPGESRMVKFTVPAEILAFYDRSMRLVVEPGQFAVMIGSSSREIRLRGGFTITGETRIISVRKEYLSRAN